MSTQTAEIPGNAGVLDVLFVLKWVKQNIKYFGGNPNKITVMGQSSGAAIVSSLLLSPLVPENLFQQMIIHSGSVFAPWTYAIDPVAYARDIAHRAKIPENSTIYEINDAFMKMDVYDLIRAANEHFVTYFFIIFTFFYIVFEFLIFLFLFVLCSFVNNFIFQLNLKLQF